MACLKSSFRLHTETVNIWSHGAGNITQIKTSVNVQLKIEVFKNVKKKYNGGTNLQEKCMGRGRHNRVTL